MCRNLLKLIPLITILVWSGVAHAQEREERIVRDSIEVLQEIMEIPAKGIPAKMLEDATAVAIIPKVIKGSFVVGARHGNGVLLVRSPDGAWHAPVFVSLTGGNVGWQVGIQSTDVVLVFKSRESVEDLLSGKFTLGADAAVAAGPVGRQAAAATDGKLSAEVYSYSRSRGVFLGVSIDGSVMSMNPMSNSRYYPPSTVPGQVLVADSAKQLAELVLSYSGKLGTDQTAQDASAVVAEPRQDEVASKYARNEADHLRDQLAHIAPEMYSLLDPQWQTYLAMPAEAFQHNGHPSPESLKQCLERFEIVRSNAQYASLANHPEFQSTYGLLKHYIQEVSQEYGKLDLPAPPVTNSGGR